MRKNLPSLYLLLSGLILLLVSFSSAGAGYFPVNSGKTRVVISDENNTGLKIRSVVSGFSVQDIQTPAGTFALMSIDGYGHRSVEGEPSLPVYGRLIEVPVGATFSVRIIRSHFQELDLKDAGTDNPLIPVQPSMSKGDDPDKVPFLMKKELYQDNRWMEDDLVKISYSGTLRALVLARIEISPVQYNPATGKLRVYDELEAEIIFQDADYQASLELKKRKASPWFNSLYRMAGNHKQLPPSDDLITSSPVTYVIVSDPMFQTTLQPFIAWKQKKGFKVIEGYTSNPAVGTTTTSIKSWLQGLYNTPPAGYNAPSFILFVGDVAQIPAWTGTAGSHVTDLRYCEYTGDNLPEVFYGRFSATTVAQLQPQIDKTLEYEQYLMPDPTFLGRAVMVAGADASYQTHSNGQIYYGTETYFNAAHGIFSHTYLQPEPSGANYSQNIKNNVSAGVAYANYTAHCSSSGWADPSFVNSDIPSLTNAGKYCLMVGNCCLSCKFDVASFAEEQLRAANKGSVGYIGGSNNTYWNEDYWWGCGYKTVVLHPAYDPAHLGAYDGTFHDHGEAVSDWFITQGQMTVCGNFAVEESTSSLKTYYWEIYHLMGDPSLMIYYSVPPALTATYANPLMIGMTSLAVATEPYAYVALSVGGTLLDARLADATGAATLNFTALNTPGMADIVITKQNRQPLIGAIQVIPASGPYVMYESGTIHDPLPGGNNNGLIDFGETDLFNASLKNVGVQTASGVTATLSSSSPWIAMADNTESFGDITPGQTVTKNDAFAWTVANNIPDQTIVPFTLQATSGSSSWNSNFAFTANAPALVTGDMTVQDNCPTCNNNGILDPGETANLLIPVTNSGHAGVGNVMANLSIAGGSSPYLAINTATSSLGTLNTSATGTASFSVTADPATPIGTPVDLIFSAAAGIAGQYTATANRQVVIGLIPVYVMNTSSVNTCVGYFYDPGGPSAPYSNSQDFTMTFNPATPGAMLKVVFTSFALESHTSCSYDYLKIYNGSSTAAPLIGTWCGTNSPGTIIADNSTGSLTFVFHSDISVTPDGWVASVSCVAGMVPNPASFGANAVSNSQIDLSWAPNLAGHPVMIAWSMNNVFGTPANGTSYTPGSSLPGGGTVLCASSTGLYCHSGLNSSTTYYYKAFSCDATNNFSTGITSSASTACTSVDAFPWTEGFEGAALPQCWTQTYITLPGLSWTFVKGNGSSNPSTAHSGNYNACLKDATSGDNITRLITPKLDLSDLPQPQLKFWHTQAYWSGDQDFLKVYYKNSTVGNWELLASYTGSITAWTLETIPLPNPSATYFIAFEGNAKYGYGVCIDDVEVSSSCSTLFPVSITVSASANPVSSGEQVTFSALAVNGGTSPQYQWLVNNAMVNGATSVTHIYSPQQGDNVRCRVTSGLECAVNNPALSDPVIMTVIGIPSVIYLIDSTITSNRCFDATQVITVAGNDHSFIVENEGSVTLIAGERIFILPGAVVQGGGYLLGYIAPEGPWCNQQTLPSVIAGTGSKGSPLSGGELRLWPNPNNGYFSLNLTDKSLLHGTLSVFNMQGKLVFRRDLNGESKCSISIPEVSPGIYLISLRTDHQNYSVRMIKQ